MVTNAIDIKLLAELNPLEPITAVPVLTFRLGDSLVVVSNHAAMVVVATLILLAGLPLAARSPQRVPKGLQNLVESVCVFLREQMARPLLGERTDTYIGFLWTAFFFILTLNLVAMVPIEKFVSLMTGRHSHFGGPATANIWITGALAIVSFVMTHAYGIRRHGLLGYLAHLAPPAPMWLMPLIYPLELLGAVVRPFSLAIRLFANIVAGHMVLGTILGLVFIFKNLGVASVSVVACAALSFLELLVAFIQAYVFTFLTAMYIALATGSEH
ncbi:MAG TPA: F0F1 ATP synthase subunit A [Sedimentisphaerales bacterium]|nr:F0F1 ATP synthase subunit A [Sedimentisphaerales bacterium]